MQPNMRSISATAARTNVNRRRPMLRKPRTKSALLGVSSTASFLFGLMFEVAAQPALPNIPGLGSYGNLATYCGKEGVSGPRWNPEELPWIGCFGLSSGKSASGMIAGHRLEVSVNARGEEECKVDGAAVECRGCIDHDDCSAMLEVHSRNSDKSVFLQLSHRVWKGKPVYVGTQELWIEFNKPNMCRRYAAC